MDNNQFSIKIEMKKNFEFNFFVPLCSHVNSGVCRFVSHLLRPQPSFKGGNCSKIVSIYDREKNKVRVHSLQDWILFSEYKKTKTANSYVTNSWLVNYFAILLLFIWLFFILFCCAYYCLAYSFYLCSIFASCFFFLLALSLSLVRRHS